MCKEIFPECLKQIIKKLIKMGKYSINDIFIDCEEKKIQNKEVVKSKQILPDTLLFDLKQLINEKLFYIQTDENDYYYSLILYYNGYNPQECNKPIKYFLYDNTGFKFYMCDNIVDFELDTDLEFCIIRIGQLMCETPSSSRSFYINQEIKEVNRIIETKDNKMDKYEFDAEAKRWDKKCRLSIEKEEPKEKTYALLATIIIKGKKYQIYKSSDDEYSVDVNNDTLKDDDLDNLIEVLRKKVETSKKETADAEFKETNDKYVLMTRWDKKVFNEFTSMNCKLQYNLFAQYKLLYRYTIYEPIRLFYYDKYYIVLTDDNKVFMDKDFKECLDLYKKECN